MKTNDKIQPLNTALPEFFLDDMERRLETDPLTLGGLVNLVEPETAKPNDFCVFDNTCACDSDHDACTDKSFCYIKW